MGMQTLNKLVLVNPPWGLHPECREQSPATPLEFLYALTMRNDPNAVLIDAHRLGLSLEETVARVLAEAPDLVVITTAPGYAAWRVPPQDCRLPAQLIEALRPGLEEVPLLACGPHGSTTPDEALKALSCDGVIRGEPEEVIAELDTAWARSPYVLTAGKHPWNVEKATVNLQELPAIDADTFRRATGEQAPTVDIEWSRGCSYSCTFCNRLDFRNRYRERRIESVLQEMETLKRQGVGFVRFIDDLFGLGQTSDLLIEMRGRDLPAFGVETRVDLWDEKGIDFLAASGCRQVVFGLESPLADVQKAFQREFQYPLKRTEEVLLHAVSRIGDVTVTLMEPDNLTAVQRAEVQAWREKMLAQGCRVAEPVRVFPYPGTLYFRQKVAPDPMIAQGAWDKAQKFYAVEPAAVS